jgi:hypothetical protein
LADLSFGVRPIELADALYNAVELSGDHGGKPGCPHVLICYQPGDGVGVVVVYGASRLIAGRTTIILDTMAPEDHVSVAIARDKADALQSALRGYGRAKATRVGVRISDEGFDVVDFNDEDEPVVTTVNLSVSKDDTEIAALADSDPECRFSGHFDLVDDYVAAGSLAGPTAFMFEAVKRVTALKGLESKVMDLATTSNPSIIALAAGPHFRGIIGELDREAYVAADSGRADHLL